MIESFAEQVGYKPFPSQILCTIWVNILALLPGFCIAILLLSVLKHVCFKHLPDCCMNTRTLWVPNWPGCLINILAHTSAHTLPSNSNSFGLVLCSKYSHACTHMHNHVRAIGAIMPARICTHRRDHACMYMLTITRLCLHVYAHYRAIVSACTCSLSRDRASTDMHTQAQSCLSVYAYIGTIMPARI